MKLIYELYKLQWQFLVVGVCTTLSRCTLVWPTVDMVCPWSGKGNTPDISMWELPNTPFQSSWRQCAREGHGRCRHAEVVRANGEMMCRVKVFCKIIGQIFLAGVPRNAEVTAVDLIGKPKKILFHRTGPLSFNCTVCNGNRCAVVAVDRSSWLRVAKFVEGEA